MGRQLPSSGWEAAASAAAADEEDEEEEGRRVARTSSSEWDKVGCRRKGACTARQSLVLPV